MTPFRYGDYIAKFSVAPISPDLTALTGSKIDASGLPDGIRDTVQAEMQNIDGVWAFRGQLARDLTKQRIEDPTVEWSEDEAPFQPVGMITVKRQDSWDARRVDVVDEKMRFSIWTGLSAHQPLGNINRARRAPYKHSADFRAKFNGCPIHEPLPSSSGGSKVSNLADDQMLAWRSFMVPNFAGRQRQLHRIFARFGKRWVNVHSALYGLRGGAIAHELDEQLQDLRSLFA